MIQLRGQKTSTWTGSENFGGSGKREREEGTFKSWTVTLEKAAREDTCFFLSFSSLLFFFFKLTFKGNRFPCFTEIISGSTDLQNSLYSMNQQVTKFKMHRNHLVSVSGMQMDTESESLGPKTVFVGNCQVILRTQAEGGRLGVGVGGCVLPTSGSVTKRQEASSQSPTGPLALSIVSTH